MGGTPEAGKVNLQLARIAEEHGLAFGLGSQRAMLKHASARASYQVRDVAPTTLLLGNLGVVQARALSSAEIASLMLEVGADAHSASTSTRPWSSSSLGGDRDFSGGLETIARLVRELRPSPSS